MTTKNSLLTRIAKRSVFQLLLWVGAIMACQPLMAQTVDLAGNGITGLPYNAGETYIFVPAPTVTSISPTAGPTSGGTSVTVTGTNFTGVTAVTFGATPAAGFTFNSATTITATAPAGVAGTVDLTVTTAGGTSATSAADQFTFVPAPNVTAISPTAGPTVGGTSVIITGTNFSGATAVTFGATAATGFTVNSATQITATSPAGTGTVDLRVTTVGGTSATSAADQFTFVAAPTVTSISPTAGPTIGGTSVVITGTHLSGATAVTFGATTATGFTVNSATQITATSPAGTGTVDIRVTTAGGISATSAADQFTFVPAPTVTSLSPTAGPAAGGTSVTVTGTNFSGATAVKFGATNATGFIVNSATSISATAPAGTGTVDIRVTTAGGISATSAADQFIFTVAPTISTPTSTNITISGATLGGNVTSDGGAPITERGVVYAVTTTNSNPQINGTGVVKVTASGTTGVFTASTGTLTASTGYSFAAYATNSQGTTYTTPVSTFTTPDVPVSLVGGVLSIDASGSTGAAAPTLRYVTGAGGPFLEVYDPTRTIGAGPGETQVDAHTVRIPLSSITSITLTGSPQADLFTFDFGAGDWTPPGGITVNGGLPTTTPGDELAFLGTFSDGVYDPGGVGSGTIDLGLNSGVTFSGLEPVDMSGSTFATFTVNVDPTSSFSGAVITTVTSADAGVNTLVSFSGGLENVKLGVVTGNLTIKGDNVDNDYFVLSNLGSKMVGDFIVDGQGGDADVVEVNNTTFTVPGAGKSLSLKSDFIGVGRLALASPGDLPGIIVCSGNITLEADGDSTVTTPPLWGSSGVWGATVPSYFVSTATLIGRGSLQVGGSILKSSGTDATLTLKAKNGAGLTTASPGGSGTITSTSNKLNVVVQSDSDSTNGGGVQFQNMTGVTTNGGSLTIGGGADPTTSPAIGVSGGGATAGVLLTSTHVSTGGGAIAIRGTGYAGSNGFGIYLNTASSSQDSVLDSGGGSLTLTGIGGGNFSAAHGIDMIGTATIAVKLTSSTGPITLIGSASGTNTNGILLSTNSAISSSGVANISLTGTGSGTGFGINATPAASTPALVSSAGGNVTLIADTMNLNGGAGTETFTTSGAGSLTVKQLTSAQLIDLGLAADTGTTLALAQTELDTLSAPTLTIGDSSSGLINVSAVVTPTNFTMLAFANNVSFAATGGFSAGVTSASLYNKLSVTGTATLDPAATFAATATGGFVPAAGDVFTLLTNDGSDAISGTFSGFVQGNNVTLGGVSKTVTYIGGTGNDLQIIAPSADLAITTTDGVTTAVPGGSVTYTITVSNAGPTNITGATVADTFPAALTTTWTAAGAGGGSSASPSGTGNINELVDLPVGGSVTYTASAAISPAATGSLSNTATISSSTSDPTPADQSATDTDTLTPMADLAITTTDGITTATAGGSTTYTITVSNSGPSNATGVTVADTFPASLTATWTGVGAGGGTGPASGSGNINTSAVNLPAGGSFTFTASCTISAAATGTLSNTATVAAPVGVTDPTPGNNSATDSDTLVSSADLSITVSDGVTTATPGGSVTYTIVVSNAGPSNATGATVADTFPASLTPTWTAVGAGGGTATASGSGNINDTVNLPVGGSVTYTVSATLSALASGSLSNTATVTAPAGVTDPTPGNNSATDTDTINTLVSIATTDAAASRDAADTATWRVTRNGTTGALTMKLTIDATSTAAATDWTQVGATFGSLAPGTTGTVIIPDGSSTADIVLTRVLGTAAEGAKTVILDVASDAAYVTGSPSSATVNLRQDGFVVFNTSDSGDSSLRQAIANANALGGTPIITFDAAVTGTITLTSGEIAISSGVTITGPGAGVLAVSGGGLSRVFNISAGTSILSGLTFTAGMGTSFGGAIFAVSSNLTLNDCVITGSTSTGTGGGLACGFATLTMNRCTFSSNQGDNVSGLYLQDSNATISNCTFSGNSGANGDAIRLNALDQSSSMTLQNCTISGNTVASATVGSALTVQAASSFTGSVTMVNCTVSANTNSTPAGPGAVVLQAGSGTTSLLLNNTLVSANLTNGAESDITGNVSPSSSYNLIGSGGGLTNGVNGNIISVNDPKLAALGNNGGPTQTMALLDGSPAINVGSNALAVDVLSAALTTDQRGTGFPRVQGTTVDIGSFEALLYTPTLTNATTNEDVQTTSGLVITQNTADAGDTTNYQITAITNGTLYQNDGTTAIANNAFITTAQGTAGLKFTPAADLFSPTTTPFGFSVQASTTADISGLKGSVVPATITVNPVADTPAVTNSATTVNTQSAFGLVITRNAVDGSEVAFFKISNVLNGTVYQNDGVTAISAGDFITFAQGNAGLKFTPTTDFIGVASFDVQSSVDNTGTGLSTGFATATIPVGTVDPTPTQQGPIDPVTGLPLPPGSPYPTIGQTGLIQVQVAVKNTTAFPINGFKLSVDYSAYLVANPSLRLYNSSSAPGVSPAYIDYPFPVAVGATVTLKLEYYTSTRRLPDPFSPILTVTNLAASEVSSLDGSGVQPRIVVRGDGTVLLEWDSTPGLWYRIKYSANLTDWYDSPVPVQAVANRTQWIDDGPPFTNVSPATVPARYYRLNEIPAPSL